MVAVLLLALGQCVAALLFMAAFLLVFRQISGDFIQSGALGLSVFVLMAFAVIGAVWGVFVRPWWLYMAISSLLAVLTMFLTLVMIDRLSPQSFEKLGPAGTVFLGPILAFIFTYPFGGIAQWLIGLFKR